MKTNKFLQVYNENNIRVLAFNFAKKYEKLERTHVYWIAKELGIYPDAIPYKSKKAVSENKTGRINKNTNKYVMNGKLNDSGVQAIESYIVSEGYSVKKDYKEENMEAGTNIWEQADLISLMKKDYEKAIAERDKAKQESQEYAKLVDEGEKKIEELNDRLLILEKENNELKFEKRELNKMQLDTVNFEKEMNNLQARVGKYNSEVNVYISEVSELRKDISAMQTAVNRLQDTKKKLDGVMSDLIGCSKRLINLK